MERVILGSTGLEISRIGFGGIPIQRSSQEEVIEIFAELIKQGINFIDTARGYTVSESLIGGALKVHGRENFVIASKSMGRTYHAIKKDFETTMKNLGIDYLDLYQLHNVSHPDDYELILSDKGALEFLKEMKAQGRIKHIGITSHNKDLLETFIKSGHFETIQFPYNAVEKQGEEYFKMAKEHGMGTIVMKPVAGGAIMNKNLAIRKIYKEDFLDCIIPGMDSIEQIRENAGISNNYKELTAEEEEILAQEVKELGNHFCRRCGYCKPCTVGIDIPANFLMEGYYTRYNLKDWAKERYLAMKPNAKDCVKCGVCESRCPYNLDIRDMLDRVNQVFSE